LRVRPNFRNESLPTSHGATLRHMAEVGTRAPKQNASAVVADVADGEMETITDRGSPVAQMIPIPTSNLQVMIDSRRARPPRRDFGDLPAPETGLSLSAELALMRDAERY
jgi:antitoxin (DNA-binding transcriptional repressor) of toxin-antitoxin stability system